jgi:tRNA threonylcarbamoyladenosine biosynthesis protein TsaB
MEHLVKLLAIDTALDAVSVCLVDGEDVLANAEAKSDRRHGEMLTPMIQSVLREAGCTVHDIGNIAVDVGPGLFTGMRVGMATAKAMAEVLEANLVGVSSLEVVAHQASTEFDVIAAVIDARRGEVFWSLHRADDREQVSTARAGSPEECLASIADRGQSVCLVGTGLTRYRQVFDDGLRLAVPDFEFAPESTYVPTARTLAVVATSRLVDAVSVDELVPMYLRAPDAEINWLTRSGA